MVMPDVREVSGPFFLSSVGLLRLHSLLCVVPPPFFFLNNEAKEEEEEEGLLFGTHKTQSKNKKEKKKENASFGAKKMSSRVPKTQKEREHFRVPLSRRTKKALAIKNESMNSR